jgi:hypothetical protein
MPYCTLSELKTYVGATGTADDTILQDCIARATALINIATNRVFEAPVDATRYFYVGEDTSGTFLVFDADLCAVTSITNGDGTAVTAYLTLPRNETPYYGVRLKSGGWNGDINHPITVVGRWAYSVVAPLDVVQAAVRLAAWLYRQKDTNADLDRPVVSPDGATLMPSKLPADVLAILRPYYRMPL